MKNNSVENFEMIACKKCCNDSIMIVRCLNEIILFSDEATDEDIEVISKLLDQIQGRITTYYETLKSNKVYKVPQVGAFGILFNIVLEVTLMVDYNRSVFDTKVFTAHDTLASLLLYLKDQIREYQKNMPENECEDIDVIFDKL